jgi:hypothetical protein
VLREDNGLTEMFTIEARDVALTPENGDVIRGEEGAVKDCPTEGMNLS